MPLQVNVAIPFTSNEFFQLLAFALGWVLSYSSYKWTTKQIKSLEHLQELRVDTSVTLDLDTWQIHYRDLV